MKKLFLFIIFVFWGICGLFVQLPGSTEKKEAEKTLSQITGSIADGYYISPDNSFKVKIPGGTGTTVEDKETLHPTFGQKVLTVAFSGVFGDLYFISTFEAGIVVDPDQYCSNLIRILKQDSSYVTEESVTTKRGQETWIHRFIKEGSSVVRTNFKGKTKNEIKSKKLDLYSTTTCFKIGNRVFTVLAGRTPGLWSGAPDKTEALNNSKKNLEKFLEGFEIFDVKKDELTSTKDKSKGKSASNRKNPGLEFLKAIKAGNFIEVYKLIKEGVDVNKSIQDIPPLLLAVQKKQFMVTGALLKHGADPNIELKQNGINPLMMAALTGAGRSAALLLEHGVKIDAVDKQGKRTALMFAAMKGHYGIVKMLLAAGANPKARDINSKTVFMYAVQGGFTEIVKLVQKESKGVNEKSNFRNTPLIFAAQGGNAEVVKLLIKSGAEVNATNNANENALLKAAFFGHTYVVEVLLEEGAEKDIKDLKGKTPLDYARTNNHTQVAAILEGKKEQENNLSVEKLLASAAARGDTYAVKRILKTGAKVDIRDMKDGFTPLMVAAVGGNLNTVAILLDGGADVNAANTTARKTPLMYSAHYGHTGLTELLLEKGAQVNCVSSNGSSALTFAVIYNRAEVAELLIEKGADVNVKDTSLRTPLHIAAFHGDKEITELLLKKGADVKAKDKNGLSPMNWAVIGGQSHIVEVLKKAEADAK